MTAQLPRLTPLTDLDGPLPGYDDLPVVEELGARHSWGLFPDPNLGTLSLLTSARRAAACAAVATGDLVNLSLPLDEPDPPVPGRERYRHRVFSPHRNGLDEEIDGFYPQGSSQWDGFKHVAAREFGWYGGLSEPDLADGSLGVGHWTDHGLIGRGVLADVAAYWQAQGRAVGPTDGVPITSDDLTATLRHQGTESRPGDVLIVRTGWLAALHAGSPEDRDRIMGTNAWPGLSAAEPTARFLWDSHVAAVASDNRAVEVAPGNRTDGYLHRRLLPLLGIPLGELWALDRLSRECAARGRHEFLFVSVPLNLPGGVGSPANAAAVF